MICRRSFWFVGKSGEKISHIFSHVLSLHTKSLGENQVTGKKTNKTCGSLRNRNLFFYNCDGLYTL